MKKTSLDTVTLWGILVFASWPLLFMIFGSFIDPWAFFAFMLLPMSVPPGAIMLAIWFAYVRKGQESRFIRVLYRLMQVSLVLTYMYLAYSFYVSYVFEPEWLRV